MRIAGGDDRLISDNSFPLNFIGISVRITDEPVAAEQPNRLIAVVFDTNEVRKNELLHDRVGLPLHVNWMNDDRDALRGFSERIHMEVIHLPKSKGG